MIKRIIFVLSAISLSIGAQAQRSETLLRDWEFHKGEEAASWQKVTVPHDWAIYGPFGYDNDLQNVAVTQNGETQASLKTGRTGGLPYVGVGWYRTSFRVPQGKSATLVFDGAMSEARVWVNGRQAIYWPYGYNSFYVDITSLLKPEGDNLLEVRLENRPNSSRWYPGAGLYRNVRLLVTDPVHVDVWGAYVTTPHVERDFASVRVQTSIAGNPGDIVATTRIFSPQGEELTSISTSVRHESITQDLIVDKPELWSPESPSLYTARTTLVSADGRVLDEYSTRFGIRSVEFIPHKGFFLNGEKRKFKGVCNHHDLGPLGAAVNVSALRHQLLLLKDMGCDAVRTSHNMPAPELVSLCDEMGFMMMIEPFDEWDVAKCKNGYHRFFADWAEKDMVNMLRQYRSHPSVVLWSIGNEVPTQGSPEGYKVAAFLQEICHREDPSRKVTCGMDQVKTILHNGFGALIDVPGLNYRDHYYLEAYEKLPQGFILGSETASTFSSRGVYKLPAQMDFNKKYPDHQTSSYDLGAASWSNIPDLDFALADDYPWTLGQFVWTGFDYLGEPTPYDTNDWPNHSSMFGIIDLASIPKDRFYLYRSQWNTEDHTLHLLPHWNWKKGDSLPVFVYTDYPQAELFVNGRSLGVRSLQAPEEKTLGGQKEAVYPRYRLVWEDVAFEPGELCVVAYDAAGKEVARQSRHTALKPHHLEFETIEPVIDAGPDALSYITVKVVDRYGRLCPQASNLLKFSVSGEGFFRACANGDPTCLELFHLPQMHAFSGMLTVIVQSNGKAGDINLTVGGSGLKSGSFTVRAE